MIEITWPAASVLLAALLIVTGGMAWYVKTSITSSLATFELSLITKLNGTYTRKGECIILMAEKAHAPDVASVRVALEVTAKETQRRLECLEEGQKHHNID